MHSHTSILGYIITINNKKTVHYIIKISLLLFRFAVCRFFFYLCRFFIFMDSFYCTKFPYDFVSSLQLLLVGSTISREFMEEIYRSKALRGLLIRGTSSPKRANYLSKVSWVIFRGLLKFSAYWIYLKDAQPIYSSKLAKVGDYAQFCYHSYLHYSFLSCVQNCDCYCCDQLSMGLYYSAHIHMFYSWTDLFFCYFTCQSFPACL